VESTDAAVVSYAFAKFANVDSVDDCVMLDDTGLSAAGVFVMLRNIPIRIGEAVVVGMATVSVVEVA
jgi:hypothetical protein